MNYKNANDILPHDLVAEIQKYTEGELLYVPLSSERKGWGEKSGAKEQLKRRNQSILEMYRNGHSVSELAEKMFLCEDTVRKIILSLKMK